LTIDPSRESLRQLSQALAAAEARFSGAAAPAATDPHAARGVEPNLVTTEESRTEEDDRDVLQFLKDLRLGGDQAQHEPAAPNELTRLFMDLLVHRDNVHAERERLRSILPAVESDVLAAMIHDFLEGLDRAAENILVPSFHSRSQSHPRNGEQRQLRGQSDRKRGSYACWICGEDKKGFHYCLLPMTEEGIFVGKNGKKWKVRRLLDDERVRAASVSKGCDRLHPLRTEAALMQSSSKRPRTLTEGSESGGESEKRRHVCNLCGFPLQPKEEHAKKCIFLPGSHTCTMSDAITRMLAEPYDLKIHGTWDTCTMSDGTTRMLAELCDPKIHGTWEEVSKISTSASHGTASILNLLTFLHFFSGFPNLG
jgi:hypothetical protein